MKKLDESSGNLRKKNNEIPEIIKKSAVTWNSKREAELRHILNTGTDAVF